MRRPEDKVILFMIVVSVFLFGGMGFIMGRLHQSTECIGGRVHIVYAKYLSPTERVCVNKS